MAIAEIMEANGREYYCPNRPVVVCYDRVDPSYLADASVRGLSLGLMCMIENGFYANAHAAMPSVTNPNSNVSIVCGARPRVHGIAGNYWYTPSNNSPVRGCARMAAWPNGTGRKHFPACCGGRICWSAAAAFSLACPRKEIAP